MANEGIWVQEVKGKSQGCTDQILLKLQALILRLFWF